MPRRIPSTFRKLRNAEHLKRVNLRVAARLRKRPRLLTAFAVIFLFHLWLHLCNPYAQVSVVQQPYTTSTKNGVIDYEQQFSTQVFTDPVSDLLGYYRQGFLIVQNTFFGGKQIKAKDERAIIREIHNLRFDPSKPYLISGDQFSVLYPRNLGVFYNQLLDPSTAHDKDDWENRQRIYLQSTLFAIDGLSASDVPKTTLVPIGPRQVIATTVHPGDVASDSIYGVLYAIKALRDGVSPDDPAYPLATHQAAKRLLHEKHAQLAKMVDGYTRTVQDPKSGYIKAGLKLSSARDGVSRSSSLYDNIILWKTLSLAGELGIRPMDTKTLDSMQAGLKKRYWSSEGYYRNDVREGEFSSDVLIGYVTGFFKLSDPLDLARTEQMISYVDKNHLAEPLPIKYQIGRADHMPFIIKYFVPAYGSDAIWSYWGAQYISLLSEMAHITNNPTYERHAKTYIDRYNYAIVRDGGFAETYSANGDFLRTFFYKSIRTTGWVVQFEDAVTDLVRHNPNYRDAAVVPER